ncbi:MAG: signal peptidase II [Lachnospiraceae bacterium]
MNENRKKMLLWSLFTFTGISGLIMLDQLSKAFASSNLKNSDSVTVIKGFFDLTYVENRGAAWGVLSGRISILVIITVILIPIFVFCMLRIYKNKELLDSSKLKRVSLLHFDLILLLSGAVGNFIDRIIKGYVVDFFQFTFFDFPVFNVADCYITIGAVFFIVIYMFLLKDDDITILFKGEKAVLEEKRDDEISDKS